jgi:hypothetical protein
LRKMVTATANGNKLSSDDNLKREHFERIISIRNDDDLSKDPRDCLHLASATATLFSIHLQLPSERPKLCHEIELNGDFKIILQLLQARIIRRHRVTSPVLLGVSVVDPVLVD